MIPDNLRSPECQGAPRLLRFASALRVTLRLSSVLLQLCRKAELSGCSPESSTRCSCTIPPTLVLQFKLEPKPREVCGTAKDVEGFLGHVRTATRFVSLDRAAQSHPREVQKRARRHSIELQTLGQARCACVQTAQVVFAER